MLSVCEGDSETRRSRSRTAWLRRIVARRVLLTPAPRASAKGRWGVASASPPKRSILQPRHRHLVRDAARALRAGGADDAVEVAAVAAVPGDALAADADVVDVAQVTATVQRDRLHQYELGAGLRQLH